MSRPLRYGLALAALVLTAMLAWTVGVGSDAPVPHRQPVPALHDSTTVRWTDDRVPVIHTADTLDALTALGYAHGLNRGWTVTLWRQTAQGRLSRWFGPDALPLDRHARRLGLAHHARRAYEQLPAPDQSRLQAYAHGLTAALRAQSVRESDPFVLFDVTPADWEPWHALLIERLMAWMATPLLSPPASAPDVVARFRRTDRRFRRWLHLHGWQRSTAWAVTPRAHRGDAPTQLFQRHVLGASADPVLQEALWVRSDTATTTWTGFPGVPLLPTGTSDGSAWASLLHSPARLTRVTVDSVDRHHWRERLTPKGGDEELVDVVRLGDTVPIGLDADKAPAPPDSAQPLAPDTAWAVQWAGFSATTDLSAWMRRAGLRAASPDAASFSLFTADGLRVQQTGTARVLGTPPVVVDSGRTLLVGRSPWARHQARSLLHRAQTADTVAPGRWSRSVSSAWAAALFPHLRPALRGVSTNAPTYLRNWDASYTPMSIGAPLFDAWMRAYRADLGHVPTLADTAAFFAEYRQRQALRRALDTLAARLGPDLSRWRWERVVSDRRYFPVWSADSMLPASIAGLEDTRYSPLERTGRGHPSTLSGGPSLVAPSPVAPSPDTWDGWTAPGTPLTVRRYRYDPDALFARSRRETERPAVHRLRSRQTPYRTLLVPVPDAP